MTNLWIENTPERFWLCQSDIAPIQWQTAALQAKQVLGLSQDCDDIAMLLELTLGEGRFGPNHWQLSRAKCLYYKFKPWLPRSLTRILRMFHSRFASKNPHLDWPIDERYARFQWELMRRILILEHKQSMPFIQFWPRGEQFAFVLTHDIETAEGQDYVRAVADLEERLGFHSSFNFVPERYPVDIKLMDELREHGFEVGVHGLCHDGKLFSSRSLFEQRATKINHYMREFGACGFRSPCTIRQPEWMQDLQVDYDLSFFDTDPYEPIPGGTMMIWPYMLGHFVELPYTLVQDYTLVRVLKHSTPKVWLDKVAFIERYHGMALLNTHPDYLRNQTTRDVYTEFLKDMRQRDDYWHALPKDVAHWWRQRNAAASTNAIQNMTMGHIRLTEDAIAIS